MTLSEYGKYFFILFIPFLPFNTAIANIVPNSSSSLMVSHTCNPPRNVQAIVSHSKKQITLSWQTPSGASVKYYQVNDWRNRVLWKSDDSSQHCFSDMTLPGTPGVFTYYLYSICTTGMSDSVKKEVVIT